MKDATLGGRHWDSGLRGGGDGGHAKSVRGAARRWDAMLMGKGTGEPREELRTGSGALPRNSGKGCSPRRGPNHPSAEELRDEERLHRIGRASGPEEGCRA